MAKWAKTKVNLWDTHSRAEIQQELRGYLVGWVAGRFVFWRVSARLKAFPCLCIRFSCCFIELFISFEHNELSLSPATSLGYNAAPQRGSFGRQMTRICLSGVRAAGLWHNVRLEGHWITRNTWADTSDWISILCEYGWTRPQKQLAIEVRRDGQGSGVPVVLLRWCHKCACCPLVAHWIIY